MALAANSDTDNAFTYPTSMDQIKINLAFDAKLKGYVVNFFETKGLLHKNQQQQTREGYLDGAETFRETSKNLATMLENLKASYEIERKAEEKHKHDLMEKQLAQEAELRAAKAELQRKNEAEASSSTMPLTSLSFASRPLKRKAAPENSPQADDESEASEPPTKRNSNEQKGESQMNPEEIKALDM